MATVTFTAQQFALVQSLLNQKVQEEAKTNVAYSGDVSNNPTFQAGDLSVAQSALAAMQSAVS